MSRRLEIELDDKEGALLRVLGTVERRGFTLLGMSADHAEPHRYAVRLCLDSERDPQVLCRQLERLVDVRAVRLMPEPPEPPPPPGFQATWL